MTQKKADTVFERVLDAASETLYGDHPEAEDLDDRYVVFEYEDIAEDGLDVIPAEEIGMILEAGAANGEEYPLFKGIEASEGYVRKAIEEDEGLMAARIREGDIASTGYMIEDGELKGLMAFDSTH